MQVGPKGSIGVGHMSADAAELSSKVQNDGKRAEKLGKRDIHNVICRQIPNQKRPC